MEKNFKGKKNKKYLSILTRRKMFNFRAVFSNISQTSVHFVSFSLCYSLIQAKSLRIDFRNFILFASSAINKNSFRGSFWSLFFKESEVKIKIIFMIVASNLNKL